MSQFHENIRTIFEDVERFLIVHIKPLSKNLSYEGRLQREKILSAIHDLKVAYPALENIGACAEFTEGGSDRSRSTLQSDTGFSSNSQGSSSGSENQANQGHLPSSPGNVCTKVADRNADQGKKGFHKSAFTSKKNLLAAIFLSRSTLHPKKSLIEETQDPSSTCLQTQRGLASLANQVQEGEIAGSNCEMIGQVLTEPTTVLARTSDEHYVNGNSSTASSLTSSIKDTFASNESACFDPARDAGARDQILISGYLEKRKKGADGLKGALLNRFQKKWCVVRPHQFEIYDRKCDKKPKRHLSLSQYEFYHPSPLVICQEARYRSFVLEGKGNLRCYHLLADSRRSVLEWKEAVLASKQASLNVVITTKRHNETISLSPPPIHVTSPENIRSYRQSSSPSPLAPAENAKKSLNSHTHPDLGFDDHLPTNNFEKCEKTIGVPLKSNSFSTGSDISCPPGGQHLNLEPDLIMTEFIERVGSKLNSAAAVAVIKNSGGNASPQPIASSPISFSEEFEKSVVDVRHPQLSHSPDLQTKRGTTSLKLAPKSHSEDEWREAKLMLNTSIDSCQSYPIHDHQYQNPEYSKENDEFSRFTRTTNRLTKYEPTSDRSFSQQQMPSSLSSPNGNSDDQQWQADQSLHLLGPERIYLAVRNCKPDGPDELELYHADPVYVISKRFDHLGWWIGISLHHGSLGFVPKCHLTPAYSSHGNPPVKANC